ncbi:GDSL esterase/lipase [Acorus gramineus]|uniref:GDSL esterase/lipase n=1 Tax=Acorus gramineus TaxID=55184 RepID=A0AAV9AUT2_ACOGR|nr:GDSL esterase/lipase [Acorus gramineus]
MRMASILHPLHSPYSLPFLTLILSIHGRGSPAAATPYASIFSFGDSLTDTGNLFRLSGAGDCGLPPYGETYFHRPTGRCCDGRLVIDFIAEAMGIPTPTPYLEATESDGLRRWGINFAVAGATALDEEFLKERGIMNLTANISLGSQIGWFRQVMPTICSNMTNCKDILSESLFLMGEIGGNDYNYAFMQGMSLDKTQTLVPLVIDAIRSTIETVIEYGATTIVVPGDIPLGCLPAYLAMFKSPNVKDYDDLTGCVNWLNKFSEYHNGLLRMELDRLQQLHPEARIIYADYYGIAMRFYRSPNEFGFGDRVLTACCGTGGPFNHNTLGNSAEGGTMACGDPSRYASWDGLHLTEAAYRLIANGLLKGPYAVLPLALTAHIMQEE